MRKHVSYMKNHSSTKICTETVQCTPAKYNAIVQGNKLLSFGLISSIVPRTQCVIFCAKGDDICF